MNYVNIAKQIADMINLYNGWYTKFTPDLILKDKICYYIYNSGNTLIGCIGLKKENNNWSKIKHVCVLPSYRKMGIAKHLVEIAINNCNTPYLYANIRKTNIPSIKLFSSFNFIYMSQYLSYGNYVIKFGRKNNA